MLKLSIVLVGFVAFLILAVTPAGNVAIAEDGVMLRERAAGVQDYCHIQYLAFRAETLGWSQPEFNPGDVVDYYGSCDFNPHSTAEIQRQLSASARGFSDGEADSAGGEE